MNIKTFFTKSEEETEKIARDLARTIKLGSVIFLKGDLGSGKTVFARGIARGLGIKSIINSPTFNIVKEYKISENENLYHFDLYRIENLDSALAFGIEEYLNNKESIALIEWPEKIEKIIDDSSLITIEIESIDNNGRIIKIKFP